jgi:ribosome-associated protein
MRPKKLQKTIVTALEDIKARDIELIDVTKLTSMFDFVVVATADSGRQARALAQHVHDAVKQAGSKVYGMEGENTDWVLVDCGDTVVHIMLPAAREHYNLEQLWQPKRAPKKPDGAGARERAAKPPAAPRTRKAAAGAKKTVVGGGTAARKPARKPAKRLAGKTAASD